MARNAIEIRIGADTRDALRGIGQVDRKLGGLPGQMKPVTAGFSRMGNAAKLAVAGGFGLAAAGIGKMVSEAREAARIGRLTEQVIKTTGGVAKVTAAQVEELAGNLSAMTGVDDELIQSGANLLLTFTNIRNELGEGNDVFDQTVSLANDMSVALGTDMKSAAMQLGKALNDPVKGVTKLTRAGVSFTDQQKDQIEALTESGRVLEAQKVILGEVGREFGGAAAAAADPMQRLGVVVNNLFEDVGMALLPTIEDAAQWLGTNLPKAIEALKPVLRTLIGRIGDLVDGLLDKLIPALRSVRDWFERNQDTIEDLTPAVAALAAAFVYLWTSAKIIGLISAVQGALASLGAVAGTTAGAFLGLGAVFVAIAAYVVVLYNRSREFRTTILQVQLAGQRARDFFANLFAPVLAYLSDLFGDIAHNISVVVGWVKTMISWIRNLIDAINAIPSIDLTPNVPRIPGIPRPPGFASGGIVPGPIGAPLLAVVHGGETVLPTHRRGATGTTTISIANLSLPNVTDGDSLVDELVRWSRRNGPLPVAVR